MIAPRRSYAVDKWDQQARKESRLVYRTGQGIWNAEALDEELPNSRGSWSKANGVRAAWRKARAAELRGKAAAPAFAALGGATKSPAMTAARRANGKKGGRPRTAGANDWAMRQARAESRVTKTIYFWLSTYSEGPEGEGWKSSGPYPSRRAVWPDLRAWREKRAAELREKGRDDGA